MALGEKTKSSVGLGTISFIALETGPKTLEGKFTFPEANGGSAANSQVVVTVNINGGATVYTGLATAQGFKSGGYASAIGDVFNVILTSALPDDNGLNTVRSTISFY